MTDSYIQQLAVACFERTGLYPISFCLPLKKLRPFNRKAKEKDLSFVIPGDSSTFVFKDEESYMNEYETSRFAITKKKGGWDCVRHLEIMAASSLPIFENIEQCPKFTLAHYPKEVFSQINREWQTWDSDIYDDYRRRVYTWFENHLTSDQMVRYILRMTENEKAKRVLFVDDSLPKRPDCQSAMILGGLKQVFGDQCEVAYPVPCMYVNGAFPKKPKWWKTNFNIYQSLDESQRSLNEKQFNLDRILAKIRNQDFDLIVYGSVTRSMALFELVKKYYPKDKVVGINGDDSMTGNKIPFGKAVKLWLRALPRKKRHSGPQLNFFLPDYVAWSQLRKTIEPNCTLFMREIE